MIVAIRISGMPNVPEKMEQALYRLRLRRKYSAVLLQETQQNFHILKKVRNLVSYGAIDAETLKLLIEQRGVPIPPAKKIDAEKIVSSISKKPLHELSVKPFFRLHPPRGGIEAKKHANAGKNGVLGENKNINELIRRML